MTDTTTTTPAVETDPQVVALNAEVKRLADAIRGGTETTFSKIVTHVGEMWAAVEPIYSDYNGRWLANEKNTRKLPMSAAKFFETLDNTGRFSLPAELTPAAVMASKLHSNAMVVEYKKAEKGFVHISGYLRYLVGQARKSNGSTAAAGLTDAQKADLAAQLMGNDGAGYGFSAMVPEGTPAEAEVLILLAVINDARVRLDTLNTVLGKESFDQLGRGFAKKKAKLAGIEKA